MNARGDALTLQVLLAGCSRGDQEAFERLYRLVSPRLFGLCLRILRREALAEEALQEAFMQIWRDADRFDPTFGEPLAWMAGIARHRAIDALRRRAEPPGVADALDGLGDGGSPDNPFEALSGREDALALHQCLGTLSVEQRDCITLAFFTGLTHPELSRSLGAPIGTVKSWIRRGLARLKRCLEA